jgi:hypothetical protein
MLEMATALATVSVSGLKYLLERRRHTHPEAT